MSKLFSRSSTATDPKNKNQNNLSEHNSDNIHTTPNMIK